MQPAHSVVVVVAGLQLELAGTLQHVRPNVDNISLSAVLSI